MKNTQQSNISAKDFFSRIAYKKQIKMDEKIDLAF